METCGLFEMDYDLSEARNYIAHYNPSKVGLIGELKQKCFMVTADGPCGPNGYTNRVFCVFPTFIISYMVSHGMSRSYDIEGHSLGHFGLKSLKLSKLCYYKDDLTSKVILRFQLLEQECDRTQWKVQKSTEQQKEIYNIQKLRQEFKKDEDDFIIKKQRLYVERQFFEKEKKELIIERKLFDEVFEEAKKKLSYDRDAFKKEKQELEIELAKYKGIVENFRKELSPYRF
jgi:hypothetical protein